MDHQWSSYQIWVPPNQSTLWCTIRTYSKAEYNLVMNPTMVYLVKMQSHLVKHHSSISSVRFSHSVVSDSLRPHELQHARPPCPSPTPGVYPNPCPLSQWCHPAISSSVISFSSCPRSFPASGSFPVSQLFASGGQSIGVSASISVLPMNTQDWSLEKTGCISLQSKGLSRVFSNTTVQKHHGTFQIGVDEVGDGSPLYPVSIRIVQNNLGRNWCLRLTILVEM